MWIREIFSTSTIEYNELPQDSIIMPLQYFPYHLSSHLNRHLLKKFKRNKTLPRTLNNRRRYGPNIIGWSLVHSEHVSAKFHAPFVIIWVWKLLIYPLCDQKMRMSWVMVGPKFEFARYNFGEAGNMSL